MRSGAELLAGLLDQPDPACVSAEDFDGPHGTVLRHWQEMGFLAREPSANPAPSCPHCDDGVPYPCGDLVLCHRCRSVIDPRRLLLWAFDREAFLRRLAREFRCRGEVRQVDAVLWQLGTWQDGEDRFECFYRRRGEVSEAGRARLEAYRSVLLLHGRVQPPVGDHIQTLSLLELLSADGSLAVTDLNVLLTQRNAVRFDAHSGSLWAGSRLLGEIPPGSREFYFLQCLFEYLDHFVPYCDLKREVQKRAGGSDGKDEATFCQHLKRRVKQHYVPEIDRLLATTNKGDGYRLRGRVEAW